MPAVAGTRSLGPNIAMTPSLIFLKSNLSTLYMCQCVYCVNITIMTFLCAHISSFSFPPKPSFHPPLDTVNNSWFIDSQRNVTAIRLFFYLDLFPHNSCYSWRKSTVYSSLSTPCHWDFKKMLYPNPVLAQRTGQVGK